MKNSFYYILIYRQSLMNEWRIVFWTAFVIFALTSVIYGIWASGEMQPWNNPEKEPLEEDGDIDEKSEANMKGKLEEIDISEGSGKIEEKADTNDTNTNDSKKE